MSGGGTSSSSSSRYETILPIGTGGMATVYVGRTRGAEGFKRLVALKRAHAHVRTDEALVESMKQEARLASRLHHANIVSVLDVDEDDGDLVLVLDYVEGCTLRTLLSKLEKIGEWRPREIIRTILDTAAGLHAAHQATDENGILLGLVHRDVSPSNVLVGVDGVSRLSDFGIAKAIFETSDRTETGILKGKTSYMAPEYVMHQHASSASDLFSLAVMAWESLTNERLFKGANDIDTLRRVASAQIRPLADERPELAPLDRVLAKALARLPSDRHSSVEEFAVALERVARSIDLVASHVEVSQLMERVMHQELEERRRSLRDDDSETVVGQVILPTSSPILPTSSPMAAAIPPQLTPSQQLPAAMGRDDVATASLVVRESKLSAAHQPAAIAHPHPPASIRHQPVAGLTGKTQPKMNVTPSHGVAAIAASSASSIIEARKRKDRTTERLALVAAFIFLGLALAAMAMQLRASSDDNSGASANVPVTTPETPPAASSIAPTMPTFSTSSAPSASAPPPTHSGRHKSQTSPSGGLMPKKAPPNPYPSSAH